MTEQIEHSPRLLDRIDFLTLAGAIVTLFVALGTESWWTLTGAATSKLFSIQVSPFYVHISAVGLPATLPLANILGSITRTLLLLGFLALFAASIRPLAWWRNLIVYFGVSTLAELYLSFALMFYWAQGAFVNSYGAVPPYFGTAHIQTNVVGLDLNLYSAPLLAATFGIPYYLGFISFGCILGKTFLKLLHERALKAITSLFPGGSINSVYFTPPYRQVWFSSGDRQFNPLQTDPWSQTDDELLVSFGRLYEKVEPGGNLSIVVPPSAATLTDRLERLMPKAGFVVDEAPGKSNNELRFTKPSVEPSAMTQQMTTGEAPPTTEDGSSTVSTSSAPTTPVSVELAPLIAQEASEEPSWTEPRMTRLEKSILKAAVKIIADRKQPVQYRELFNQIYMELVDHKIEFDSARQIEATLLSHNGWELQLIEEEDDAGLPTVKKWTLGKKKMTSDKRGLPTLGAVKEAGAKLPHLTRIFKGRGRPRYRPKPADADDSGQ